MFLPCAGGLDTSGAGGHHIFIPFSPKNYEAGDNMRLLNLYCTEFEYKDVRKSRKPVLIARVADFQKETCAFQNTLVVWICIENGDTHEEIRRADNRVARLAKMHKTNRIIMLPFVHLSKNIPQPAEAKEKIARVAEKLEGRGFEVHLATFGTQKNIGIVCPAKEYQVSYSEFNPK